MANVLQRMFRNWKITKIQRYFLNWLCWLDTGLNTLCAGDYRETCSSRLGRYYGKVKLATFIADCINWVAFTVFGQKDHCQVSIQCEKDRTAEVWK